MSGFIEKCTNKLTNLTNLRNFTEQIGVIFAKNGITMWFMFPISGWFVMLRRETSQESCYEE